MKGNISFMGRENTLTESTIFHLGLGGKKLRPAAGAATNHRNVILRTLQLLESCTRNFKFHCIDTFDILWPFYDRTNL